MAEIYNGRYALADPSSGLTAFSMECGEINMFGRCTLIRTTQRDSYPIINDAPIELEVKKESNLFDVIINGAIGISMGILLGACAVSIMVIGATTGGAALPFLIAAIPFMVASTAAICTTVGTIEKDLHTGYKRNSIKFFSDLSYSAMDAFTTGATIAEVLAVSTNIVSYMGACAVAEWGASFFTKDIVPAIISSGIGTTVIAEGAFAMSDANERITGYNWILDKVFRGNNELYEDSETFVDMLCESLIEFGGLLPDINTYSNNMGDMPDDGQAQKPSHTANTDGAGGEKAGNSKATVSLEKAAESTIGTGQSGKSNSSYNNYDTGQWGKSEPAIGAEQWGKSEPAIGAEQWGKDKQTLDLPEDKENTTDEVWYEEGVVLECYIDRYSNENEEEKEEKQYNGFEAGRRIDGGGISKDDPIVDEMLNRITEERKQIEKELLLENDKATVEKIRKGYLVGNVAVAKVDMKKADGGLNDIIMAYSGCNNIEKNLGYQYKNGRYACEREGDDRIFDTLNLDNWGNIEGSYVYDRSVDSEAKILEEIAHRLEMEKGQVDKTMRGTIYLATDRAPCQSCKEVIKQFQDMFPYVKVIVIYKYKYTENNNKGNKKNNRNR